jgi:hypothetical protein
MSEKRSTALLSKMNVRPEKIMTALLGLLAISGIDGRAQEDAGAVAPNIKAIQEDEKTIRVVVPGQFETTFTRRKGFGAVWFDLKYDPQRKRDLAPVLDENGFLWVKNGPPGADGSWYANPPLEMTVLESGPTRVRVHLSGTHQRYGQTKPEAAWKELGFEQNYTIYPSGAFYVDYALIAQQPREFHHFLLILKPNGAWGNRGKGEGAGEVRCAGEFGPSKPYGATASSFALEWTDGPTYFQDILLVMHKGKYNGSYWNEGYVLKSARDGLAFALHGKAVPRMFPCFKIKDWPGAAPESLTLGGEKLEPGKDFNASVRGSVLLLQMFRVIKDDVNVAIPGP